VWAALCAAIISFALCPLAGWCARLIGIVSLPAKERWHVNPTPLLGGLAIAAGTVAALYLFGERDSSTIVLVGSAIGGLTLGLVDDKYPLGPTAKLVGSLVLGAVLVYLLNQSAIRVLPAPLVVLAVIWFAIVVHAVNILDNMDGLAAGVCAITATGTAIILLQAGAPGPPVLMSALAGALVGFLPWNMHPARLFMGDAGSLFVGSLLAGASLLPLFSRQSQSPLVLLALALTLIVPVGEAVFVSALRWMAGRKPTRGGIDHSSHRLVAIGFSERRSVLVLCVVALAAASIAGWMARSGAAALPAMAALVVGIGLGAIYLAFVPTYQGSDFVALARVPFSALLRAMVLRSHAAEVLVDLVLITACYYSAYRLRFEGESLGIFLPSFAASLPVVIVCKLAAHYASGLYRRSWFTFGVGDIAAVCRAVIGGTTAAVLAATYLYRFERFSRGVFIIDAILLLVAIVACRLSFRLMAHAAVTQSSRARRVLICGAGERGQLLAREMLANTGWGLRPVGFVDGIAPSEHSMLGLQVHGTIDDLTALLRRLRVEELVFSGDGLEPAHRQAAMRACDELSVPVRELVFDIRQPRTDSSGTSAA
jgi:UDP-GlcNAc:undecaprenyl-phosphate/decaprenyl-phosphate GlcNAc-1-phosphate transferase